MTRFAAERPFEVCQCSELILGHNHANITIYDASLLRKMQGTILLILSLY